MRSAVRQLSKPLPAVQKPVACSPLNITHHSILMSTPLISTTVQSWPSITSTRSLLAKAPAPRRSHGIPIIAICHLSWKWVWQRPQQFLSRHSKRHPLLFVETHCSEVEESFVVLTQPEGFPSVTVMEMHLPASRWHDGAFIDSERRRVMLKTLEEDLHGKFRQAILWFNDPMAVTAYAGRLGESVIVYDCMDELSQFKGCPEGLIERELELTRRADVIFCGGRGMRDKRLPVNPNCHFYGTGVDCPHFAKAMNPATAVDPHLADIEGPILGYFGVIDERIDYELLEKLADADPSWTIAMVGPFAKVSPEDIPQRPNLLWLGGRSYDELPSLTKAMDVCMMPFALNAATEYINPTKALEYMAAGKPVVSTPLQEVRRNFSRVSRIAKSHDQFIEFCRQEVAKPCQRRIKRGLKLAAENTWEAIAAKMEGHIDTVLQRQAVADGAPAKLAEKSLNARPLHV